MDDSNALADRLCVLAGKIMEDVSVIAVSMEEADGRVAMSVVRTFGATRGVD